MQLCRKILTALNKLFLLDFTPPGPGGVFYCKKDSRDRKKLQKFCFTICIFNIVIVSLTRKFFQADMLFV